jgi:Chromo (CHRromatin Organisation MOdifier) domain
MQKQHQARKGRDARDGQRKRAAAVDIPHTTHQATTSQPQPVYNIDRIIDKRYNVKKERLEYRVLWEGYGEEEATWMASKRLVGAAELLAG